MEYYKLNNGLEIPMLGLGTWDLRGGECEKCVATALELGYRLIDTAQMYGNEKEIGRAIKSSKVPREQLFVTTKIYRPDNSYAGAKKAIEVSLERMGLEYLDLVLIHEPYQEAEEMYRAMQEAYEQGKVKALGISNFNARRYQDFVAGVPLIPAVNQVEAHVFYSQLQLGQQLGESGTFMQAWSPFGAGKKNIFANKTLVAIGKRHGKSAAQVALRYLIQSGIGVIPKSASPTRMAENMAIFDFELSLDEMREIAALNQDKSLFGWY